MTNTNTDWEKRFDDEVDRLVALSLRDPSVKPLTELKRFIRTEKSKSYQEGVAALRDEVAGWAIQNGITHKECFVKLMDFLFPETKNSAPTNTV